METEFKSEKISKPIDYIMSSCKRCQTPSIHPLCYACSKLFQQAHGQCRGCVEWTLIPDKFKLYYTDANEEADVKGDDHLLCGDYDQETKIVHCAECWEAKQNGEW